MSRTHTNSLAALAAVFLAITSISAITTVPPAQAHGTTTVAAMTELA
ncbi:hypothetical protein [Qipengyuania nanhaisediminis]